MSRILCRLVKGYLSNQPAEGNYSEEDSRINTLKSFVSVESSTAGEESVGDIMTLLDRSNTEATFTLLDSVP